MRIGDNRRVGIDIRHSGEVNQELDPQADIRLLQQLLLQDRKLPVDKTRAVEMLRSMDDKRLREVKVAIAQRPLIESEAEDRLVELARLVEVVRNDGTVEDRPKEIAVNPGLYEVPAEGEVKEISEWSSHDVMTYLQNEALRNNEINPDFFESLTDQQLADVTYMIAMRAIPDAENERAAALEDKLRDYAKSIHHEQQQRWGDREPVTEEAPPAAVAAEVVNPEPAAVSDAALEDPAVVEPPNVEVSRSSEYREQVAEHRNLVMDRTDNVVALFRDHRSDFSAAHKEAVNVLVDIRELLRSEAAGYLLEDEGRQQLTIMAVDTIQREYRDRLARDHAPIPDIDRLPKLVRDIAALMRGDEPSQEITL